MPLLSSDNVQWVTVMNRTSFGGPSGTAMQDFYIWRMPEHDAAIQLNFSPSRQEVKRRNNNITSVTFQNKTIRVDTSTQISHVKETNTSSSANSSVGNYGAGNMTMFT